MRYFFAIMVTGNKSYLEVVAFSQSYSNWFTEKVLTIDVVWYSMVEHLTLLNDAFSSAPRV